MSDYREELESAVDYERDNMPANVRQAIRSATASLYDGPVAGTWESSLDILRDWKDGVRDVTLYDYQCDDDGEEVEVDVGFIDSADIVCKIVGAELARYL